MDIEELMRRAAGGDLQARAQLDELMRRTPLQIRSANWNEERREVPGVLATENPVRMYDWATDQVVDEVLRADGVVLPSDGEVPLLDTHSRWSIRDIAGRVTAIRVDGRVVVGMVRCNRTELGNRAAELIREGDLRDLSAGYRVLQRRYIPRGVTEQLGERTVTGPAYIAEKWALRETSLCAIGADVEAKLRAYMPVNNRGREAANQEDGVMEFELQDGRRVSLAELERLRREGPVTLRDGTVMAQIIEQQRAAAPVSTPVVPAAPAAPVVPTGGQGDQQRAAVPGSDGGAVIRPELMALRDEARALCDLAGPLVNDAERETLVTGVVLGERTLNQLREDLLSRRRNDQNRGRVINVGEDAGLRSVIEAIPDAILLRSGIVNGRGEGVGTRSGTGGTIERRHTVQLHARAGEFSQLSLQDMLRMSLEAEGIRTVGRDVQYMLEAAGRQRSMNTPGNFGQIMLNALNKVLATRYALAASTYREICVEVPANDLRPHNLFAMGGFKPLRIVNDAGEVQDIVRPDGKREIIQPKTYAGKFVITDETIINDDMSALTDTPGEMAASAEYTVNELFYARLLSNPLMLEDGVALYDAANHGNFVAAAETVGASALDAMQGLAIKQRGLNGRPIGGNLQQILLTPAALWGVSTTFLNSTYIPGDAGNVENKWKGMKHVYDPLLDLGAQVEGPNGVEIVGAGQPKAFYTFANPAAMRSWAVAFYGGNRPQLRQDRPLGVLGTQFEVVLRFDVRPVDWRGTVKHKGEA